MSISSVRNVCSNSSSAQDKTTTKRKTSESFEASKEETFVSVEVLKEKVMSQYEQSKASFMQVLNNKDTLSSDERIALINEAQALKNEIKGSVLKYYGVVFEVTKTFTEKNGEDLKKINTLFSRKNGMVQKQHKMGNTLWQQTCKNLSNFGLIIDRRLFNLVDFT